jgi:hypothetical protein
MEGMTHNPDGEQFRAASDAESFQVASLDRGEALVQKRYEVQFVGPDDPWAGPASELVGAVFLEKFGNTPEQMEEEYGPYKDQIRYLVVIDHEGANGPTVSGAIEIIENGPAGFKSLNDLQREPWQASLSEMAQHNPAFGEKFNPETTWDIASLAVAPEYRGRTNLAGNQSSAALFRGLCHWSQENGITSWVAVLDDKVLEKVVQPLGQPFAHYEDPNLGSKPYLGSPASTPVYCDFSHLPERLQQDARDIYTIFFEGEGVDDFAQLVDKTPPAAPATPIPRSELPIQDKAA